ncbi:hypothetical protein C8R45DRAFT_1178972 [Mycena sanguinolenta]|nr:hypothetical protein C8R45DRAFT_1178972 [Mycena sanguinolenta]
MPSRDTLITLRFLYPRALATAFTTCPCAEGSSSETFCTPFSEMGTCHDKSHKTPSLASVSAETGWRGLYLAFMEIHVVMTALGCSSLTILTFKNNTPFVNSFIEICLPFAADYNSHFFGPYDNTDVPTIMQGA